MADAPNDAPLTRSRHRPIRPIRLDMTPLVDLAFLLLSFFVVTTTLRHEQVLALEFPSTGEGKDQVNLLTLLVAHRDECYAYRGAFDPNTTQLQRLDPGQLSALLELVTAQEGLTCVLKPHATAKYGAIVDMVDELHANRIGKYDVNDSLAGDELAMLERKLAAPGR